MPAAREAARTGPVPYGSRGSTGRESSRLGCAGGGHAMTSIEVPGAPSAPGTATVTAPPTITDQSSSSLRIPELPQDCTNLTAAMAYADCGWYVAPVLHGTKD